LDVKDHWVRYPNDVLVSRWGVVVKRADATWYAYPMGSGEMGPYSSLTAAQSALTPIFYTMLAVSSARS
jgi:hypothetical protein